MIDIFAELDKKFNIIEKTKNLSKYLNEEQEYNLYGNYKTFIDLFDRSFHQWELNNNYNNLGELLQSLELANLLRDRYDDNYYKIKFTITNENDCYKFLQLIKNAVSFLKEEYKTFDYDDFFKAVENKIKSIVTKANLSFILDEQNEYYKLIENKPLVREIAERTNEDLAYRLYEYNAIDNRQNLTKKKEILFYLATYTESITKCYGKKSGDIFDLYHNLDFALNNFHVRHDNKNGKKKKEFTANLTDAEQIDLYDKIFDLFLEVLTIENTSKSLDFIKSLKDKFDEKLLS